MSNIAIAWKFWILWALVCVGSGVGCSILGLLILLHNRNSLGIFVGLSMIGILWATPQYLLLKNYTPINGIWVLVSAAGIIASSYIAQFMFAVMDRNLGWAVIGAVGAIFPYFILRQHFLRASSWILASGVSVAISMTIRELLNGVVAKAVIGQPATGDSGLSAMAKVLEKIVGGAVGFAVSILVALAIYGAITGGTLVWLLRHPRRK